MKILITGANGMVARATAKHCSALGDEVFALTRAEMGIADIGQVESELDRCQPDAVINCAAYTNVDGAETEIEACYRANSDGPEHLAHACKYRGIHFVTISTDYVFDGERDDFYYEDDAANPQGVYAQSKFEGEKRVGAINPDATIVRSGWIYGTGGTNFLSVMHRLLHEGKRIKAIRDSYGTPTFAGDLARRLRELAERRAAGLVHVTNAGDGTSYLGFAEAVCEIGGYDHLLIDAVGKDELQRPAPRPASSRLVTRRNAELGLEPLPPWEGALARFLAEENEKAAG
ncbi:MAG: dTDP-4-dehydrorhamnose reductase, partial [Pyrinomonadaceae bacterium]|nr:dTDP-4-dehydrorhamnose reductase [Pyrinomonadaceae bacterium]